MRSLVRQRTAQYSHPMNRCQISESESSVQVSKYVSDSNNTQKFSIEQPS